jgi:hypothetical protein
LPAIDSPKTPDHVGTSFTLRPRTSRVVVAAAPGRSRASNR